MLPSTLKDMLAQYLKQIYTDRKLCLKQIYTDHKFGALIGTSRARENTRIPPVPNRISLHKLHQHTSHCHILSSASPPNLIFNSFSGCANSWKCSLLRR
mmetsp:Transcript_716/g.1227  ORF Transcript_716/g.1227 Transcript_716/m.1227 type:complete len:99 (+) Transcript_716:178-474(+)